MDNSNFNRGSAILEVISAPNFEASQGAAMAHPLTDCPPEPGRLSTAQRANLSEVNKLTRTVGRAQIGWLFYGPGINAKAVNEPKMPVPWREGWDGPNEIGTGWASIYSTRSLEDALAIVGSPQGDDHGIKGIGLLMKALVPDAVILDFDRVLNEDGSPNKWGRWVLKNFGETYVEVSPGGRGLRVVCKGSIDWISPASVALEDMSKGSTDKAPSVEVYTPCCGVYTDSDFGAKFVRMSGAVVRECSGTVEDAQQGLDALEATLLERKGGKRPELRDRVGVSDPESPAAAWTQLRELAKWKERATGDILRSLQATAQRNPDARTTKLMQGDFSLWGHDASRVDYFAVREIIKKGGGDFPTVLAAWKKTPAYRHGDKPDTQRGYVQITIVNALDFVLERWASWQKADEAKKPATSDEIVQSMSGAGIRAIVSQTCELHLVDTQSVNGRVVRRVMHEGSRAAGDALRWVMSRSGKSVSDAAITQALSTLRYGQQNAVKETVHVRTAGSARDVFVRLQAGYVAHVTPDVVEVLDEGTVGVPLFATSTSGDMPIPETVATAQEADRYLMECLGEWNIPESQRRMLIAALLAWHLDGITFPIVELIGGAGSGKSTLARFILSLIDPSPDGEIRSVGQRTEDVAAAAQGWRLLVMDNLSKVNRELSDTLCIVSTGGVLHPRRFHAQAETISLSLHRPLLVTAITPVCLAADLQSRVVRVHLGALQDSRRSRDSDMRRLIEERHAKALGALLTLLQHALRHMGALESSGSRLGDYDAVGEAVMRALGCEPGTFYALARRERAVEARVTLDGDAFTRALCDVLVKMSAGAGAEGRAPKRSEAAGKAGVSVGSYVADDGRCIAMIEARPSALLTALKVLKPQGSFDHRWMPEDAAMLSRLITRVEPTLKAAGCEVRPAEYGTRPLWCFEFFPPAIAPDEA